MRWRATLDDLTKIDREDEIRASNVWLEYRPRCLGRKEEKRKERCKAKMQMAHAQNKYLL